MLRSLSKMIGQDTFVFMVAHSGASDYTPYIIAENMLPDYNGFTLNNVYVREADESGAVLYQCNGRSDFEHVAFDGSGGVSLVDQTQVTTYDNLDAFAIGAIGDGQQVFISDSATLQNDEFQIESLTPNVNVSSYNDSVWLGYDGTSYGGEVVLSLNTNTFLQNTYGYDDVVPFDVVIERWDPVSYSSVEDIVFRGTSARRGQTSGPVTPPVAPEVQANVHVVTVIDDGSGNKYEIDGVQQDALNLVEGETYVFDWSAASGHPLRLSTNADGTHAGGVEYVEGVVVDHVAFTTTITVAEGAPDLYYYCEVASWYGWNCCR